MSDSVFYERTWEVDPGSWTWLELGEVEKGDVLQIIAREDDGQSFDLLILSSEAVTKNLLLEEHSILWIESDNFVNEDFRFKKNGLYSLVVSNHRAREYSKDVYLKLGWKVSKSDQIGLEKRESIQSIDDVQFQEDFSSNVSWKGVISLLALLTAVVVIAYFLYLINPFLGGAVMTLMSIMLALTRKDIREILGLDTNQ